MYIWNRDAAVAMYTGFGFFKGSCVDVTQALALNNQSLIDKAKCNLLCQQHLIVVARRRCRESITKQTMMTITILTIIANDDGSCISKQLPH